MINCEVGKNSVKYLNLIIERKKGIEELRLTNLKSRNTHELGQIMDTLVTRELRVLRLSNLKLNN